MPTQTSSSLASVIRVTIRKSRIGPHAWEQEQARLHQEYTAEYEQYKPIRDDLRKLQQVKRNADAAIHQQEQTRQKRREVER